MPQLVLIFACADVYKLAYLDIYNIAIQEILYVAKGQIAGYKLRGKTTINKRQVVRRYKELISYTRYTP